MKGKEKVAWKLNLLKFTSHLLLKPFKIKIFLKKKVKTTMSKKSMDKWKKGKLSTLKQKNKGKLKEANIK